MSGEFTKGVDYGLMLSKRIYYGKQLTAPPVPEPPPTKKSSLDNLLPSGVMVYASVNDPESVDNPDVPSYQPYVYGRCDSPALVPLHMQNVEMEVDCWMDTAFVTVEGSWRVHCIMTGKRCDFCVAVPMGEKGSLLGAEVAINGSGRSYHTKLDVIEDSDDLAKVSKGGNGRFLKSNIYTFKVPKVVGGSILSIKVRWSQKLIYSCDGQFSLDIPFTFPAYTIPVGKKIPKKEKILLNVNSGLEGEILCNCISHPLKILRRDVGRLSLLYEAEVLAWSAVDFQFSYSVPSSELLGGVFLQSPSLQDYDDRDIFCFYLLPGTNKLRKAFKMEIIFVIDTSGSMQGAPLEDVKNGLLASLAMLKPQDSFNIIAFNEEICLFSSFMELATPEAILNATQWLHNNLIAAGGTSISLPLKQAMKLLAETNDAIPLIFLVTDGAVEDEREICNLIKQQIASVVSVSPRICTFGIGLYCNHHFLQMLAQIGKGHYDSAFDGDSVELRMQRLFTTASSVMVANIVLDPLKNLDSLELFPSIIPDLSLGSPLIISGRYDGDFPDIVKFSGTMADKSIFVKELKVQRAKNLPIDRVLAKNQIDILTSHAWFSGSKDVREKVARISLRTGFPCEYTSLLLLLSDYEKTARGPVLIKEVLNQVSILKKFDKSNEKMILMGRMGIGFGDMIATSKNIPPGIEEPKSPEGAELFVKAATSCCHGVISRVCCMCFIRTCSHMNNQCSILLAQVCVALSCFECVNCCFELCECG